MITDPDAYTKVYNFYNNHTFKKSALLFPGILFNKRGTHVIDDLCLTLGAGLDGLHNAMMPCLRPNYAETLRQSQNFARLKILLGATRP